MVFQAVSGWFTDTKFHRDPKRVDLHTRANEATLISLFSVPLIANIAGPDGSVKLIVLVTLELVKPDCGKMDPVKSTSFTYN